MIKAAVVTDLHLGGPQTSTRMTSFTRKVAGLQGRVDSLCICGDTFTLTGKEQWASLINGRALTPDTKILSDFSRNLVDEHLPVIAKAARDAGINDIFMIPGNADSIAYYQIQKGAYENKPFMIHKNVQHGVMGLGGIEPDCDDATKITQNNPWYKGVMNSYEYQSELNLLFADVPPFVPKSFGANIFMTHMPAYGYLDSFKGKHNGSKQVLNAIEQHKLLLHLCGHIHDGPFTDDGYKPFDVIGWHTVTVNPGGGLKHDGENGVMMVTVDVEGLSAAKKEGRLAEAAPDLVRPV